MAAARARVRWCLTWRCHGPTPLRRQLPHVSWWSLLYAARLLRKLPVLLWRAARCAVLSMLCGRVVMALCGFNKVCLG